MPPGMWRSLSSLSKAFRKSVNGTLFASLDSYFCSLLLASLLVTAYRLYICLAAHRLQQVNVDPGITALTLPALRNALAQISISIWHQLCCWRPGFSRAAAALRYQRDRQTDGHPTVTIVKSSTCVLLKNSIRSSLSDWNILSEFDRNSILMNISTGKHSTQKYDNRHFATFLSNPRNTSLDNRPLSRTHRWHPILSAKDCRNSEAVRINNPQGPHYWSKMHQNAGLLSTFSKIYRGAALTCVAAESWSHLSHTMLYPNICVCVTHLLDLLVLATQFDMQTYCRPSHLHCYIITVQMCTYPCDGLQYVCTFSV